MNSFPKAHIILLNWNNWQDTLECLESLQSLSYPNWDLTVVDNGSSNDSAARIRQAFPAVHLMAETQNWGFAEGNNIAMRYALEHGADYIWLLNNDTLVEPDSLSLLVEAMEADPTVGAAGPKIYFANPADMIWFAGAEYRPWFGQPRMFGYGLKDDGRQWEDKRETAFVTGCALLTRASLLRQIGLLDADYFFLVEDLDFGLRVQAGGYRNLIVPASHIHHKESASSGGLSSPHNLYYGARNRLMLMQKRGRARYWPTFLLHFLASMPAQYLVMALLRRCSFASFWAICLGMRDFARGQRGAAAQSTLGKIRPAPRQPASVSR